MTEKQKTLCPDCNSDNYKWFGYDDECKCLDCECVFNATMKQKTCLTEKDKDEVSLKIAFQITTIKGHKEKIIHAINLTEKAIMKKAVPKEDYDELKEELKQTKEESFDLVHQRDRWLRKYHQVSDQFINYKENLDKLFSSSFEDKIIPKEKVRTTFYDDIELLTNLIKHNPKNKERFLFTINRLQLIKKQLLGEK